jgi:DNA-binding response OmpR family regulator
VQNRSEALLLVEDEYLIASLMSETLIEAGFVVEVAHSAQVALTLLDTSTTHYAGIITDISLGPKADGWAVALRARERNPEVAVIYSTGGSGADWTEHGVPNSILIQKPFPSARLVATVNDLLGGAARRG